MDLKEAAILVLGTISEENACLSQMTEHLPTLIPILIQELNSESSLIRASSLFVLEKYSQWITA